MKNEDMLPIKCRIQVINLQGSTTVVNSEHNSISIIDMIQSKNVELFKLHVMEQANLQASQAKQYLVWLFIAKNQNQLRESPFSQHEHPILTLFDLKECFQALLHLNAFLVITLQKFPVGGPPSTADADLLRQLRKSGNLANNSKQKRKAVKELEFDLEGAVNKEREHLMNYERPSNKIYPVSLDGHIFKAQTCAFCGQESTNEQLRKRVGPVYGPIKIQGGSRVYVHELCAIWTPEVYLDDRNKFKNLAGEVQRSRKLKCAFCMEKGAGLGCYNQECQNTYHFLCAREAECVFDRNKFLAYCPDHASEAPKDASDLDDDLEESKSDDEEETSNQKQQQECDESKSKTESQNINKEDHEMEDREQQAAATIQSSQKT